MTPADLAEARRLADAATPGPWYNCGKARGGCVCGMIWSESHDEAPHILTCHDDRDPEAEEGVPLPTQEEMKHNAAFIAASRSLVPDLLAHIEVLSKPAEYRPGLPSVEQVRTHEAQGGWWMEQDARCSPPIRVVKLETWLLAHAPAGCSWRPCTPDGTPCAWPVTP